MPKPTVLDLICGDCLTEIKALPNNSVDMLLTDPPYQCTACSWDVALDMTILWPEIERVLKPGCAALFHGNEPFASFLRVGNIRNYKYDWVWDKKKPANYQLAKKQPMKYHEFVVVFYSKRYYPQMVPVPGRKAKKGVNKTPEIYGSGLDRPDYLDKVYTDKYPSSIIQFSNANQTNRLHRTQKPVELLAYLIQTYTLPGEIVLDLTMGSGSTGMACLETDRGFIGIEKDEGMFKIARDRVLN